MLNIKSPIEASAVANIFAFVNKNNLALSSDIAPLVLNNTLENIIGLQPVRIPYFLDLLSIHKDLTENKPLIGDLIEDLYEVPELIFALVLTNIFCLNDPNVLTDKFSNIGDFIQSCITKAYDTVSQAILITASIPVDTVIGIESLEQIFSSLLSNIENPEISWNDDQTVNKEFLDIAEYAVDWLAIVKQQKNYQLERKTMSFKAWI